MRFRPLLAALIAIVATAAPASADARPLTPAKAANRCIAVGSLKLFVKPTGLGRVMLHGRDAKLLAVTPAGAVTRASDPDASVEWALRSFGRKGMGIRSVATKRWLKLGPLSTTRDRTLLRVKRSTGCRAYPEAELNATGDAFTGPQTGDVVGIADPHVHLAAELRAGGLVISGSTYDRFGITEALGNDEDVHGENGADDITGNLLRTGNPVGTHDTHGWPTFKGWPTTDTYTHHQAYYRWLQRAWLGGLRLVGAMVVEDTPLCDIEPRKSHSCDETETAELQVERLRGLQDYVDAQAGGPGRGWFRIVTTPAAARRVIRAGKLAAVLGFESSNPFGCDLKAGVAQCDRAKIDRGIAHLKGLGIRSLFVAHWVDNALAGAALEGGDKGTFIAAMQTSHTGQPFTTGACPHPGQGEEPAGSGGVAGKQCNQRGLTELGEYAVGRLMDQHMLIEVDHLSELARDRVLDLAQQRGYPLVSSHTGTGGAWVEPELRQLRAVGGFASATLDAATALPDKVLGYAATGFTHPGLSTDTGGFASLPAADPQHPLAYPFRSFDGRIRFGRQRTGERTFDLNEDGMAHYGLLPDLLALTARQPRGRAALDALFGSAEAYLDTWQRTMRR